MQRFVCNICLNLSKNLQFSINFTKWNHSRHICKYAFPLHSLSLVLVVFSNSFPPQWHFSFRKKKEKNRRPNKINWFWGFPFAVSQVILIFNLTTDRHHCWYPPSGRGLKRNSCRIVPCFIAWGSTKLISLNLNNGKIPL